MGREEIDKERRRLGDKEREIGRPETRRRGEREQSYKEDKGGVRRLKFLAYADFRVFRSLNATEYGRVLLFLSHLSVELYTFTHLMCHVP